MRYLGDFGHAPQGYCLCADPVHLHTDTTGLILFDSSRFALSEQESHALIEPLRTLLSEDGWRLEAGSPQRWYLSGRQQGELVSTALERLKGKPVANHLPEGIQAAYWRGLINEIQMLLHSHPVNRQRLERGEVPVNSLWLWGGSGSLQNTSVHFNKVWTNDPSVHGAARHTGSQGTELPPTARDLLDDLGGDGHHLLVLDQCRDAAAYEELHDWCQAVQRLEKHWISPLWEALTEGRIGLLKIIPVNGFSYTLTSRQRWYFWRRLKNYRSISGTSG